jgi:FkbM family methyltransferase
MLIKKLIKKKFVFVAILCNYLKYRYLFLTFYAFYQFFKSYYSPKREKESIESIKFRHSDNLPIFYRPGTTDQGVLLAAFHNKYQAFNFKYIKHPVIFDLGANAGYCSRYFLMKYPDSLIIAVELDLKNFNLLTRNTEYYNNCKCYHAGIWFKDGKIAYSGTNEDAYHIEEYENTREKVDSICMQSLINMVNVDWIDYIKMDIEGAEQKVFLNDLEWLDKVGCINLEYHNNDEYFYRIKLQDRGFKVIKNEKHWAGLIAFKV